MIELSTQRPATDSKADIKQVLGKNRIAFFVNNHGYDDNRVRKTAETLADKGYACTVYGITSAAEASQLEHHQVQYHLLPAKRGLLSGFLVGIAPRVFLRLANILNPFSTMLPNKLTTSVETRSVQPATKAPTHQTAATYMAISESTRSSQTTPQRPKLPFVKKNIVQAQKLIRWILKKPILMLQPHRSGFGATAMFGNYIRCLLPAALHCEANILYCHELWTLPIGALATQSNSCQLVYDSHELEAHRNNNWSAKTNAIRVSYERRYIVNANSVTTVCRSIADEMSRAYGLNNTGVVPNAPLSHELIKPEITLKQLLRLPNAETKLLVYTGKVTSGRGLHDCIQILKYLPNYHFALVGPRVESIVIELAELSEGSGAADRVHFVDPVHPSVLVDFISDADVALIPIENVCLSYYYSLPNKIFEAAMAGLPIVTSQLPELESFTNSHNLGQTACFQDWSNTANTISDVVRNANAYNNPSKSDRLRTELSFEQAFQNWPQV